ncbi:MAG: ClbS/DfsB family four-helix bundle protein [Chloroflexi bacterium]|nr:ClbS/DfsB family four-helix bundle protein [Chloroflexota bacterium]
MSEEMPQTKTELLLKLEDGWDTFMGLIRRMDDAVLTGPADDAGWTIRDHIAHLAVWEDGIGALLNRESRTERMGIEESAWATGVDHINAVIQQRYKDVPLARVLEMFEEIHHELIAVLQTLSDEDLQRPYNTFAPESKRDDPVVVAIVDNSYGHYEEHTPWIQAIAARA